MKTKITIITILLFFISLIAFYLRSSKNSDKSSVFGSLQLSNYSQINLEKSHFMPNEEIYIQITADCSHDLELKVNDQILEVNPTANCGQDSNIANFYSTFKTDVEGGYKLQLNNKNLNQISESGFVISSEKSDYEIYRWGSKSINVDQNTRAVMKITVLANQDIKGQLIETIPSSDIEVVWLGVAKQEENNLIWNIELKAGEKKEFNYEFISKSGNPITLGLARLVKGSSNIYQENLNWQVNISKR